MIAFVASAKLPHALTQPLLGRVGRELGRRLRLRTKRSIGVRWVSESEMRQLNRTYRQINRPTDVLSFSSDDSRFSKRDTRHLGDLAICVPYASREAKRRAIPLTEELVRLLVHGTLHLSGYDHATAKQEEAMFALQEGIIGRVV